MKFTKKIINTTFKEIFLKKRKRLFISLGILASVAIAAVLMLLFGGKDALAAWFDESFGYRQRVDITNSGTAQTDYQVAITLDTAALITAGKIQSDCDDIRITDANGKLLPHWIETGTNACNTTTTAIWTKIPSIYTSGTTVYLYYGNPSATNTQNGNNVFSFFDDFSGPSIDSSKWTQGTIGATSGTNFSQSSGNLVGGNTNRYIQSTNTFSGNYTAESRTCETSTAANGWSSVGFYNSNTDGYGILVHAGFAYFRNDGGWTGGSGFTANQCARSKAKVVGTAASASIVGETSGSQSDSSINTGISNEYLYLSPRYDAWASDQNYSATWDWVFVRKAVTTEPTVASPTNEEKSPAPVAYWKFDEGYGTMARDSTQNSQNFTSFTGSPAWQTEDMCITGKCLRFPTRDDYTSFTVSSTSPLNLGTSNFTISTWQKVFQPVTSGSGIMGRYPHNTSYNGNWSTGIADDLTTYFFYHRDMSGALQDFGIDYSSYFGKWTHVEWVKSGSTMYLYINGKLKQQWTITITFDVSFSGVPFYLSQTGWAPGAMANLTIDDLKIYNYDRTAAKIKSDYTSRGTTKGAAAVLSSSKDQGDFLSNGLVGYWKMDEASGNFSDYSGNNNTGAVSGSSNYDSGKFGNSFRAGEAATNMIINPSLETNMTSWNYQYVSQGSATTSTDKSVFGSYSLKITRTLAGSEANVYNDVPGLQNSTVYYFSTWAWASTPNTACVFSYLAGTNLSTVCHSGSSQWERIGGVFTTSAAGAVQLRLSHSSADLSSVYFDGMQVELGSSSTSYIDGSLGAGYAWTGTAHASTSTRAASSATVSNSTSLDITSNQISFSTWVKPIAYPTTSYSVIFQKGGYTAGYRMMLSSTGKIYVDIGATSGGVLTSTGSIPVNSWTQITTTYDGQNIKIFFNGALDSSTPYTNNLITTANGIVFGSTEYPFLHGLVDETRIYNRALSTSEVTQLYNWAPGPNAYWNFENDTTSTITDKSGNGLNLSISGSPTFVTGKYGKALKINGGSDAATSVSTSILDTDYHTIGFWLKFDQTAPSNWGKIFGYTPTGSDRSPGIWTYPSANCLHWRYDPSNSGPTGCGGPSGESTYFTNGQWYYITGVKNGGTFLFYVNGVQVESGAVSNPKTGGSSTITLGGGSPYVSMDEVKIYNYARNSKQIVEDMNASHPAPGSPVGSAVGYWKFDEGHDTTAQDSNQNDLDLTISGASWSNNGKFGKALSLDGNNDYAYKSDNDALDLRTGGFTATAWINVQTNADGVHDIIVQKGATSNPDPGYWFGVNTNGYLDLYINNGGTYLVYGLTSIKYVADSQWHHISFTWDPASGAKLYVDGLLDNTASATSTTDINHTGQINVGGYTSATFTLNGKLDEVKLYNSTLTADQIKLDYNQGKSLVMGATSTDSSGNPDNSSTREYCIPGSTDTCIAPAGEWNFEEGTGGSVNDSSGNGNMGTWQGTLGNQWTNGKIGKAGKFNGTNNYVTITDNDTLDFGTGDFSISAWIKHSATLGSSYDAFILGKWGASAGYLFSVRTWSDAPGKLSFALRDNGTTWVEGKSNTAINDNTWHHVTVTTNRSGNATFYLDGKPDGSFSISSQQGNLNNNIDPLIGYGNSYFNGQIDQVRVYNYARTPAQIAWDYNRGGPVGHWKFDECQGAAANDSSGNGNSGTITEPGLGSNVGIGTCTGSSATMWKDGTTGKFNSSLEFDGTDDYVNVGSYSSLNSIGDNISVSAWVKTSVNNTFQTIVGRGNDWRLWKNNSYYGFEHRNASNGIVTPQYSNTSTDWVHVVGTYQKDGYVKLYLNGILVDSDAQTGATRTSQTQNQIGNNYAWHGDGTYNDYWFNGQIDEVKIFNYTLTQQQIRDVYTGGAVRFGPSTGSP